MIFLKKVFVVFSLVIIFILFSVYVFDNGVYIIKLKYSVKFVEVESV